ncbi:hypothetical protein [Arthrobacter cupressi]|uniref:Uncharacterized protein n=1 Tax=Arthrobacter cupressi TaxID=1045773 RepID=A0A1G8R438_9MICC|nr:hypothetical protein [Arthrobacter cupressi]NYD77858.1 hypothetical protein [Arthrobacter cupressi]SDJ11754.1 hypothetical protein SAMN05216555_10785 [Arthrobacter cupressi]
MTLDSAFSRAGLSGPARSPGTAPRRERGFAGTAAGALGVAAVFGGFALALEFLAGHSPRLGPVSEGWAAAVPHDAFAALRWFLGDMSEPQFYKSELASLGLLAGAGLAWWAGRRRKRWAGAPLVYGTGLWPWLLASTALGLLLSNLAFGRMLDAGWQPTFVPFVSVAPAVVLVYGPGWKTCLSGAVLGALTTTPLALLLISTVSAPLGLPAVVACVVAMALAMVLTFAIARKLPWLVLPAEPFQEELTEVRQPPSSVPSVRCDARWAARRVLQDFSEAPFFANELASLGLLLGVAAAFVLNPALPAYGSELLPQILFAQALSSAIGVVLWRAWYRDGGWAATYASVVSVAPVAVLTTEGSWTGIVGGAVLGAVLAPPVARAVAARLPKDFHPSIGNTVAMAVATAVSLPVLGLLPG